MPYFDHDGLRFHYEEAGAGRPFIFQHGLGGDTAQPLGLLKPPAGIRLIAFDCRGHGQTALGDPAGLTFETLRADWAALMDHLGLERAIAGGISLGAALALHLALNAPERVSALVLVRPAWLDGPLPDRIRALYADLARLLRERGARAARPAFAALPDYQALRGESEAAAEAFMRQFESAQAEAGAARLERLPGQTPHPRGEWPNLQCPVLVATCRGDSLHPFEAAEGLAVGLPRAVLVETAARHTDGARHAADVQRAVETFLAQHHLIE